MSVPDFDLSYLARDTFVLLQGVTKIIYRNGEVWELEDDDVEHPLVPRLRAASVKSLIEDPPELTTIGAGAITELQNQLKEERRGNDAMREFLFSVQKICLSKGMGDDVKGGDVLGWIDSHLNDV